MWTGYTNYYFRGPYNSGTVGDGFAILPGYDHGKAGYWGGVPPVNQAEGYKMNQAEADKSICAIIQSLPILETAPTNEKEFYPILFENTKRDWHIGSNNKENLFPVTIGERYKNGKKNRT